MVYHQQMYQDNVLQPEINGESHMFESIDAEKIWYCAAQYLFSLVLVTETKAFLWGCTCLSPLSKRVLDGILLSSTVEPVFYIIPSHYPGYNDAVIQRQGYGALKASERK